MADYATTVDRELGLARIAEIREAHQLRSARAETDAALDQVEPGPATPAHDPTTCVHCLGQSCFWCEHVGADVAGCEHTLSQRHGAPLEKPPAWIDPDSEPPDDAVLDAPAVDPDDVEDPL